MNKRASVAVTDHALMRYIERVMGIDLQHIRDEIAAKVSPLYVGVREQSVVVDGFRFVIADGHVATVHDASTNVSKTGFRIAYERERKFRR